MTDFRIRDSDTPGQVKLIAFQKYVRINVKVEKLGDEFRIIPDRSGLGPDIMISGINLQCLSTSNYVRTIFRP